MKVYTDLNYDEGNDPGIGAAPGLVCRMLIQMMLLILNTNGAEFAPQLNASIAGTIRFEYDRL